MTTNSYYHLAFPEVTGNQEVVRKTATCFNGRTYVIIVLELTRTLAGFEFLNNATLIFQKWLVSRHFANIFHYLIFCEEYLCQFS